MHVSRSALVRHSAMEMYRLVEDVAAYPDFLSWCAEAEVHEQDETVQVASLTVSRGVLHQRFTTRNRLAPGESIAMELVDGPFSALSGAWRFVPLGEHGSRVALDLTFEFASALASLAFNRAFARITERMVRDFCLRADALYDG